MDYDAAIRRTSLAAEIANADDFLNTYQYDNIGRMTLVDQDEQSGGNSVPEKRVDFEYNDLGLYPEITRYTDVAGTLDVATSFHTYDDANHLTDLDHKRGSTVLADYDWVYAAGGRLTSATTIDGTDDYTYDDTGQVTDVDSDYQTDESYTYDDNGNRTNTGYTTGTNNQVTSDGTYNYEYHDEGNRTKKTTISGGAYVEYEWDHRNRLTAVTFKTSGGTKTKEVAYTYDAFDRRIGTDVDSDGDGNVDSGERYVYDASEFQAGIGGPQVDPTRAFGWVDDIVMVFDDSGNLVERLLHGPGVDAQHATVLATAQEELATLALSDLESMTMTVLDGDFERKVIAAENVYFTKFAMPADENDARHYNARFLGSISPIPATVPTAVAMLHPAHGQLMLQNVATDPAVIRARMKVAGLLIGAALVGGIWLYRRGRGAVVGAILICCCLSESTAQDDTTAQQLTVPQIQQMLSEFHQSSDRSGAIDRITSQGAAAVPALLQIVRQTQRIEDRGWAIVCLTSIGGDAVITELRQVANAETLPPLVRVWAASSLISQADSIQSLTSCLELSSGFPALRRPLELRVAALKSDSNVDVEDFLRLCAVNPDLQQTLAPQILKTKPAVLANVLMTSNDSVVRQQAAAWLATMKARNVEGVNAAVIEAVKFDKTSKAVPWGEGPLYIPGLNWEKTEAVLLINELTAWYVICSKQQDAAQSSKIITNLNSLQLMNAAGFRQVPSDVLDWLTIWPGSDGGSDETHGLPISADVAGTDGALNQPNPGERPSSR